MGPANKSIPTLPYNWRFASATNILPGPTNISTPFIVSVPIAIAATACIPPKHKILSAPPICIAATIAGCGSPPCGGADAIISLTPATFAVNTDIWAEATIGYFPPGT